MVELLRPEVRTVRALTLDVLAPEVLILGVLTLGVLTLGVLAEGALVQLLELRVMPLLVKWAAHSLLGERWELESEAKR